MHCARRYAREERDVHFMECSSDDFTRSRSEYVYPTIFEWKTFFRSHFRQGRHKLTFWTLRLFLTIHTCTDYACHCSSSLRDPKAAPGFAQHLLYAGVKMAEVDGSNQASDGIVVVWQNHGVFCVKVKILIALESSSASQNTGIVDEWTQRRQWGFCGDLLQLIRFAALKRIHFCVVGSLLNGRDDQLFGVGQFNAGWR